jgi:type VI secretion system protein ImpC
VKNSETSATLKIRKNLKKKDLHKDLTKAVEFDQSQVFKKIYELNSARLAVSLTALIGTTSSAVGPRTGSAAGHVHVAAASFAPFISAANPKMLRLESNEPPAA